MVGFICGFFLYLIFFFFFQAEDGIRDYKVTGVQTCALPILAAMGMPIDPAQLIPALLAPGIERLGERLVRTFIGVWDSPEGRHLVGLLRSVEIGRASCRERGWSAEEGRATREKRGGMLWARG